MAKKVTVWTDGSSNGSHGKGGWAAILIYGEHEKVITGNGDDETNNSMEFKAIVEALSALKCPCEVRIVTDSQLAIGAFSLDYDMKAAHLIALCDRFDEIVSTMGHTVTFKKVPGHEGIEYNERVDKLAKRAKTA